MPSPGPLPDLAVGPPCIPGVPVALDPVVARLTAPNPSMMTGPGTNTYVVGTDEVVVLDPGPLVQAHLDAIVDLVGGRRVRAVCVTHHHHDHGEAADELAARLGAPVLAHGHASLRVDEAVGDGDEVVAGDVRLVAWHTPGHASDHLCFLIEPLGWLLTGDHLMEGSTVVIRPPDGDLTDYLAQVARVRDAADLGALVPGHGRQLGDPVRCAADVLEHRARRGEVVAAALRSLGSADAAQVRAVAYADVGVERDEVATASCWAHLLALVTQGAATSSGARDDPRAIFSSAR